MSTRVPPEQYMFGARAATEDFLFTESQSIQREQEKIYIGGLQMVEWMKVRFFFNLLNFHLVLFARVMFCRSNCLNI